MRWRLPPWRAIRGPRTAGVRQGGFQWCLGPETRMKKRLTLVCREPTGLTCAGFQKRSRAANGPSFSLSLINPASKIGCDDSGRKGAEYKMQRARAPFHAIGGRQKPMDGATVARSLGYSRLSNARMAETHGKMRTESTQGQQRCDSGLDWGEMVCGRGCEGQDVPRRALALPDCRFKFELGQRHVD